MREYKQFSPYKKARMIKKIELANKYYKEGYSIREIMRKEDIQMSQSWVWNALHQELSTEKDKTDLTSKNK